MFRILSFFIFALISLWFYTNHIVFQRNRLLYNFDKYTDSYFISYKDNKFYDFYIITWVSEDIIYNYENWKLEQIIHERLRKSKFKWNKDELFFITNITWLDYLDNYIYTDSCLLEKTFLYDKNAVKELHDKFLLKCYYVSPYIFKKTNILCKH